LYEIVWKLSIPLWINKSGIRAGLILGPPFFQFHCGLTT